MLAKSITIDSDTVVHVLKACSAIGDVKTAYDVIQVIEFSFDNSKVDENQQDPK